MVRLIIGVLLSSSPAILMGKSTIQEKGSSRKKLLWMCFAFCVLQLDKPTPPPPHRRMKFKTIALTLAA